MAYLVFFHLLRHKSDQRKYDINDLKRLIICIAELHWRRTETEVGSQEEKAVRVLQQMEVSTGFQKMVDKSLKENNVVVSFFKKGMTARIPREIDRFNMSLGSVSKSSYTAEYSSLKAINRKE